MVTFGGQIAPAGATPLVPSLHACQQQGELRMGDVIPPMPTRLPLQQVQTQDDAMGNDYEFRCPTAEQQGVNPNVNENPFGGTRGAPPGCCLTPAQHPPSLIAPAGGASLPANNYPSNNLGGNGGWDNVYRQPVSTTPPWGNAHNAAANNVVYDMERGVGVNVDFPCQPPWGACTQDPSTDRQVTMDTQVHKDRHKVWDPLGTDKRRCKQQTCRSTRIGRIISRTQDSPTTQA